MLGLIQPSSPNTKELHGETCQLKYGWDLFGIYWTVFNHKHFTLAFVCSNAIDSKPV